MARISAGFNYVKNVDQGSNATDEGAFRPDGTPRATVDPSQALADFDAAATTATTGGVALLTGAGSTVAYSTATHQYSGVAATSSTISQANGNALIALLNTVGADLVTAKGSPGSPDVVLDVNATNVPSWSRLRLIVLSLLDQLRSSMAP